MTIREGVSQDLTGLTALYKTFFPTHNRFQREEGQIVRYLNDQAAKNKLLVVEKEGKIVGGTFLITRGKSADGMHMLWKFRHFAYTDEKTGTELLSAAEKHVADESPTAKIELTLAETEPGKEFYLSHGYAEEGKLENHYRFGETCFVLGKSLS